MARYTGPRVKRMRALGVSLPGLSRKTIDRRPSRPGMHGAARRRPTDYAERLIEKQKLIANYGLGERQLRRLVQIARRSRAPTGEKILELLERRLDNAVFRAGLAPTVPAARQLVTHGHIQVNGRRADIPSMRIDVGDVIAPRPRSRNLAAIQESLANPALMRPDWLEPTDDPMAFRVAALPGPESVPFPIDMERVVEYYAGRA